MSKHVVYSISSVLISAFIHHRLKQSGAWCPLGRVASNLAIFLVLVFYKPKVHRLHNSHSGEQNTRFAEHRQHVSKDYQSGRVLPVGAMAILKNACFCLAWLICDSSRNPNVDEFSTIFFLLFLTDSKFYKAVCSALSLRLLYKAGLSMFTDGLYSACLIYCTWILRDPFIYSANWLVFAVFWAFMASKDSVPVCLHFTDAIPPVLPILIAVRFFYARPVPLLILSVMPEIL